VDRAAIFLRKNPATFIFLHPIKEVTRCGKFSENGRSLQVASRMEPSVPPVIQ
jgi:hypothetical protein